MTTLYVDIETFSHSDVRRVGAYRHAEDPHFLILMAAWAHDDGPVRVETDPERIRSIPGLLDPGVRKVAHNSTFERVCFSTALGMPVGEYLDPQQWDDTMASARAQGWPAKLETLAKALQTTPKDTAGTRLINIFSKPNRAGGRNLPTDKPEQWEEFKAYCRQDVETMREIDRLLGPIPHLPERRLLVVDQRINDRGLMVDIPLARRAVRAGEINAVGHELELIRLTGVDNPNSQPQMLAWLQGRVGAEAAPNLTKETVADLLLRPGLDETTRRALRLRRELAMVAAKKFDAALRQTSADSRLRGQLTWHGAHTGRWTGSGVQVHNLPKAQFTREDPATGKAVHDDVAERTAILDLTLGLGADALDLKKLVRSMFLGPFTVVDYASIEARVIAWLAREEWALEAFRLDRDIYVETAERMSTPTRKLSRSQGKVAVLALGYNGGVKSLRVMGAEGTDDELQQLVWQWRGANPAIVDFWKRLEVAFLSGGDLGLVKVERLGKDRTIVLPSGRRLVYHGVHSRWVETARGRRRRIYFKDWRYGGASTDTYGGRLAENCTQAVARDVLGEALVRLHDAGHRVVGHVHDEILVEGSDVEAVERLMVQAPRWAKGLPIAGEGFSCQRYRKQ